MDAHVHVLKIGMSQESRAAEFTSKAEPRTYWWSESQVLFLKGNHTFLCLLFIVYQLSERIYYICVLVWPITATI